MPVFFQSHKELRFSLLSAWAENKHPYNKLWSTFWMREKKLCRSYIRPWRVDGSLLLDIRFCKNPRILWWNVSFWFNDFSRLQNFRDTWKYRKNNQNYKKCLNTFNNALKNKLQYWNTEDIPPKSNQTKMRAM